MLAEKIRKMLAKIYKIEAKDEDGKKVIIEHRCTATIGAALFMGENSHINDILRNADDAMYQAKNLGRNRICFYNSDKTT